MADAASPFAFIDGALDRAEHLRNDTTRLAALWPGACVLLLDAEGHALADAEGAPRPLAGADIGERPPGAVLLGLDGDGRAWFALAADTVEVAASGAPTRVDLRTAAATWPLREATAFAQARAVLHWRARHRYCGACGGALAYERAGWLGRCTRCRIEHYPRTDPAVIVAVSDGQRLLLGRQSGWPARRYSVIAGFVEPGESLEQTVVREVFEETRVRVRSCRYLGAQPWPFPGALMLGFAADAEPDPPQVDGELEEARWFGLEEIAAARQRQHDDENGILLSPRISIARSLIEHWYAGMTAAHA